jgi:hypothetical protein
LRKHNAFKQAFANLQWLDVPLGYVLGITQGLLPLK